MFSKSSRLYDRAFSSINYVFLGIFSFVCIYPFYYVFIYSISIPAEAQRGIYLLPAGFTWANYEMVFRLNDILQALFISVSRTVLGTVVTIICCSFFSYLVAQKEMNFRKLVYRFTIFTMYFNAGIIPWYLTMRGLGLKDNFLLYIIPAAITPFYVILIKTYIEQIPFSLSESAKIDGAGHIRIFSSIIFPVSTPIIATIAVFSAVGQWGAWFDNFLLVSRSDLQTLQLILYNYLNTSQSIANLSQLDLTRGDAARALTPQSIKATITILTTLPIVFVYPWIQKYFVKGIMLGAVKG
ncbi:carbohydrate ABC transporter permease [Paenibacillus sp. PAMC21692]|uniref:carbohydrate ABC transporter permease n=1 Tax=Paenibacillus sp. PAMC21692 TaxID=2762320 RepID=UPI00164ED533|nr:carbohydrate ABC transporter permease [Paenibacillus sp. PAMC21692]QNK58945.1 carbohydrate ABC transporter permease [Paenibacillus sp. PAMC21692]